MGYTSHFSSLGLWTGHKDEEASSISFNAGGIFDTDKISNCCVVKIPYEGSARERLLKLTNVKSLIGILIENWNPDYAFLTSHNLSNLLIGANQIGWVSYSKHFINILETKNKIVVEKHRYGHLCYLNLPNDNSYDYNSINKLLQMKDQIK